MHLGGGNVSRGPGPSETPALPAVKLKAVILVFVKSLVPYAREGLAHPGEVPPAFPDDGFALGKLEILGRGPEIQRAERTVERERFVRIPGQWLVTIGCWKWKQRFRS